MNEKLRDVTIIAGGLSVTALFLWIVYMLMAEALFLPVLMLWSSF